MSVAPKNVCPVYIVNGRISTVGKVVQRLSFQGNNNKGVGATRWAAVALSNSCSFAATSGSFSSLSTHPYMLHSRASQETDRVSVCVSVISPCACVFSCMGYDNICALSPPGPNCCHIYSPRSTACHSHFQDYVSAFIVRPSPRPPREKYNYAKHPFTHSVGSTPHKARERGSMFAFVEQQLRDKCVWANSL